MITTSSTSSTSSINATATSSKRLSGLVSGLDTDTLVQQMSSGTQNKIDKQMQSKQIALWKQQSYRSVTTALTDFETKYFSTSSSSSNISDPSFFNSTSINNTSKFLNVSGSSTVAKNMVVTGISQLAKQASFSSNHNVSNETITTGVIASDVATSKVSGDSLTLTYGGKDYELNLSSDLAFTSTDAEQTIVTELNKQIASNADLKGKVSFSYDEGNKKVTLTATDTVIIKDGNVDLLTGLGLTSKKGVSGTTIAGDVNSIVQSSLFSTASLASTLSGSTLTFSLNGVSKNITFDESDVNKDKYSTPEELTNYLQGKLKTAFGTNSAGNNNVSVVNSNGKLSFTTADPTSIVSIDSSDKSGILGMGGALRVYAGETNRINPNKTLADIADSLNGTLSLDSYSDPLKTTGDHDAYGLTINGKKFTFKSTDTIDSIITTINNSSDANVTMSYSSINDSFSVTAKDGGSSSKVDIGTGSLANALFGQSPTAGAAATYDFTGKTATDLVGKTISVSGTTYEFTTGGSVNGTNNKAVDTTTAVTSATAAGTDAATATTGDAAAKAAAYAAAYATTYSAGIATAFASAVNSKAHDGYNITATDGQVSFVTDTSNPPATALATSSNITGALVYQGGADAKLKVSFDGNPANAIDIVRSDNKFSLDGVNFELLGKTDTTVTADAPITFSVNNKTDDLYTKIKGFVDDYNALIGLANDKVSESKPTDSTYLPLTDAQKKTMSETQITSWETNAKKGLLKGDSILNTLSLNLRHSMTDTVASMQSALYTIGIATKANDYSANGKLTVDETALKNVLNTDPDKVAALFTGTDGISARMKAVIDSNIKTTGGDGILIATAGVENSTFVDDSAITKSLTDYDTKIKELQTTLKTQQDQYYAKFTKLEQYMSQMNSQASLFTTTASS